MLRLGLVQAATVVVVVCVALALAQVNPNVYPRTRVFDTSSGPVQGFVKDSVAHILGIPYAAPPVGSARWTAPQPPASWTDIRNATRWGPACYQNSQTPGYPIQESEDCLYLNVYTPNIPGDAPWHVLVWFHGGGYAIGSGGLGFSGTSMVNETNSILVTVNYRLGPLGFLGTSTGTNNFGLLDQRAALEWVQNNIDEFNGDPEQITIFGESAGGGSVALHLVMQNSFPYYRAAILQSPGFFIYPTLAEQLQVTNHYAAQYNCSNSDPTQQLNCLRQVPAQSLVTCQYCGVLSGVFIPCIDGVELTDQLPALLNQGKFNKVPLLIGSNSQEGNIFAFQLANNSMYMSKEQYSYLNDLFMSPHGLGLLGPAWYSSLYQSGDFWHTFGNSFSDYALTCGTRMIANAYSAKSAAPVYRYLFSHTPDLGPLKMLNATHATEIPYVFYHTRRFSPREVTLSAEITSMWSNFARCLSPTGCDKRRHVSLSWPEYVPTVNTTFGLDIPFYLTGDWEASICSQWENQVFDVIKTYYSKTQITP